MQFFKATALAFFYLAAVASANTNHSVGPRSPEGAFDISESTISARDASINLEEMSPLAKRGFPASAAEAAKYTVAMAKKTCQQCEGHCKNFGKEHGIDMYHHCMANNCLFICNRSKAS